MSWTHRTLIVTAANQVLAQGVASALAPASGAGMWTTPLSATGQDPATHYVSAGLLQPQFADLMDSAPNLYAACQMAGPPYTLDQLSALLATSVIVKPAGTPDALGDIAAAGLKIINPVTP